MTKTTRGFEHGAHFLVTEVLPVQLDLLQVLLPMDYWLVGRQEGEHIEVLASFGGLDDIAASALAGTLTPSSDVSSLFSGFRLRSISQDEWRKLDTSGAFPNYPRYVFTVSLPDVHGPGSAMVAGFMQQEQHTGFPVSHTPAIVLCLTAIAQTVNLHVRLGAAEKLMRKTQEEAQLDALTKVLNRAGWEIKLREAARTGAEVAVGFLDLDCLKAVNDSRGHPAGDELLRLTARTLQAALRSDDQIARLGGDEFAVMLHNETMASASSLKERLQFALSTFDIQASIGIALGSEAASLQAAVQLADARMYDEKRARRRSRAYGAGRPTIIPR